MYCKGDETMRNISMGRYVPYDTIIHRLDARVKLLSMIAFVIVLFMDIKLPGFILLSVLTFVLLKVSKVGMKSFLKSVKILFP